MKHRTTAAAILAVFIYCLTSQPLTAADQPSSKNAPGPNILWIVVEDMSAHFSCYGEKSIETPNVDKLAKRGIRYTRAFTTGPICSISRSALITGCYQTSTGAQNHRSNVPDHQITLPSNVKLIPHRLKEQGYHVNNVSLDAFLQRQLPNGTFPEVKVAKTDYNFEWNSTDSYDNQHWGDRPKDKPFFVQIQLTGGKYRGQEPKPAWPKRVQKDLGSTTSADTVKLPAYLPDHQVIKNDWAQYLDTVRYTDWEVGLIVDRLDELKELDNTVIFFFTDHGLSHVRNKQFLYDGGTHIPLIVAGPQIPQGQLRRELVEHIDISATTVALANASIAGRIEGKDLFSPNRTMKNFVFSARDRADETVDLIRSVRSEHWKYIRNGFPNRPYLQPNQYKDSKAIVKTMRSLHETGSLTPAQAKIMSETRPLEELYDLTKDPDELVNLAESPDHVTELASLRKQLQLWQQTTGDPFQPESEQVYESEVNTNHTEGGKNTTTETYQSNAQLMKKWRTEKPFVGW